MGLPVDHASQSRSLQSASTQVEGKGHQRIKLAIGQGYFDQAQDCVFRCPDVTTEQFFGLSLGNTPLVLRRFPNASTKACPSLPGKSPAHNGLARCSLAYARKSTRAKPRGEKADEFRNQKAPAVCCLHT